MIRNDSYSQENFLYPEFDIAWPFYTVESDYLSAWVCLIFAVVLAFLARNKLKSKSVFKYTILTFSAVGSLLVYTNFLTFHGPLNKEEVRLLQTWDMFHYIIGSRYQPELGYDHFYDASLLALREIEREQPDREFWTKLSYRDMRTYQLLPGTAALLQEEEIKALFPKERWVQFVKDIRVFYEDLGPQYFYKLLGDHGYNPPPTHTLIARVLIGKGDLTRSKLLFLASIDGLLLILAFALLSWGFGFEAALISTVLFGVAYMSNFSWVGNAFLRFGWLTAIIAGIVFQKKNRPVTSGICLGIAAGLRVFPGLLLFSLAFPFLWGWKEEIRQNRKGNRSSKILEDILAWKKSEKCMRLLRTTMSAAAFLVVWGSITTLLSDRPSLWNEWSETIALHSNRLSANHVGLRVAVTIDPELTSGKIFQEDADAWWNQMKQEKLIARSWIYIPIVITYLGLLLACARKASPDRFLLIALTSLFFLIDLSGYYYSFLALLPLPFLGRTYKNWNIGYASASVLALVIMSQYWIQQAYRYLDWIYALASLVLIGVLLAVPITELLLDRSRKAE